MMKDAVCARCAKAIDRFVGWETRGMLFCSATCADQEMPPLEDGDWVDWRGNLWPVGPFWEYERSIGPGFEDVSGVREIRKRNGFVWRRLNPTPTEDR